MIKLAGVGPGNPKYLTMEVYYEIKKANQVLAFGRVADSLKEIRDDIVKVARVDEVLDHIKEWEEILILASGDPNFFGLSNYLDNKGVAIDEILPGLSSFQYMMAKLGKSWDQARFLSLHGREDELDKMIKWPLTVILTDREHNPAYISKALGEKGLKGKLYLGFNLSYENEKILTCQIGQDVENISPLAVVVVENEMD